MKLVEHEHLGFDAMSVARVLKPVGFVERRHQVERGFRLRHLGVLKAKLFK